MRDGLRLEGQFASRSRSPISLHMRRRTPICCGAHWRSRDLVAASATQSTQPAMRGDIVGTQGDTAHERSEIKLDFYYGMLTRSGPEGSRRYDGGPLWLNYGIETG
jgi:hypothetical protein